MGRITKLLSKFGISFRSKLIKNNQTQPTDGSEPKDFISDLPRDIIEAILERLPLKEAIKTSVLSKKWRYKWSTMRRLDFGTNFSLNYTTRSQSCHKSGFENIINSIFHLHSGGILSFILILPKFFRGDNPDFDKWMLVLSNKGVKSLILMHSHLGTIKLPNHFFSCKDLTDLTLCTTFLFEPPPSFVGFKYLTTIYFRYVQISNDVFETLVSGALQLVKLEVHNCRGLDHMNVHAPNLRHMSFTSYIKTVNFGNMPHLESASLVFIMLDNDSDYKLSSSLVKAAESWRGIKKLSLENHSLKVFAAGTVPMSLPTKFYHLTCLELKHIDFKAPRLFYCAVCLIKSSPNLQKLDIFDPKYQGSVLEPITKFMEVQDWTDCSLDRLQTVRMNWIKCVAPELLLLRDILRISPVLEIVSISAYDRHDENFVMFKAAVEQFDRASPNARVSDPNDLRYS